MMRLAYIFSFVLFSACTGGVDNDPVRQEPPAIATRLDIVDGQTPDGHPNDRWLAAIRVFHSDAALARIAETRRLRSEEEQAWYAMIASRADSWPDLVKALLVPFAGIEPPESVDLVIGNIGGQDAFIDNDRHIAFDVARLFEVYGSATLPANADRIDRFFRHEFTHLLHKEWRRIHKPEIETPLERALWVCLTEGLGNYQSLSSRWRNSDGSLSAHAENTIERLAPILVERLGLLAEATDAEAGALMAGLSMGPFEDKWGALPVALWLSQEARDGDENLRPWVEAGPWGILDLLSKYLPPNLASELPHRPETD